MSVLRDFHHPEDFVFLLIQVTFFAMMLKKYIFSSLINGRKKTLSTYILALNQLLEPRLGHCAQEPFGRDPL